MSEKKNKNFHGGGIIASYDGSSKSIITKYEDKASWNSIKQNKDSYIQLLSNNNIKINSNDFSELINIITDKAITTKAKVIQHTLYLIPTDLHSNFLFGASKLEINLNIPNNIFHIRIIQGEKQVHCYENMHKRVCRRVRVGFARISRCRDKDWTEDRSCNIGALSSLQNKIFDEIETEWNNLYISNKINL